MSTPDNEEFLHRLEIEVEAELEITESSNFEEVARTPVAEWRFDPTEAERYEINLRGLLGAVEAVEDRER
ncbi:hypothetical protein DMH01_41150 [Amycolatopsis sp. WAC 04182]|uniref:hypothetical protein n=1 Tax=Amycolatopsis sp. WAC 04182 TaxID=2203198 RepID=UPI000F790816|nr:hypothetical protein [Amycolatopsis sp. WAC 04182]RSN52586.1 hypothetical protein DMH01_41150 [Amycolatopsis sp. WAC 04182]